MSSSSSFDAKQQIRQAIDIVDLVGDYIQLRREGRGFKGICPWHDDTRPSLQVNPERQSFKCWVCDVGGDVFSFMMRAEGVEFREALGMLAERAGISLGGAASGGDKRLLYEAMAWAEGRFHDYLMNASEGEPARKYLVERGITPESMARFHLGFSPDSWNWLLNHASQTRFSPATLERIGLARPRNGGGGHYDWFRGRVLFSIRDAQGRSVGAGGRVLPGPAAEETAKYVNSPETPLFAKSNLLYGLDIARQAIAHDRTVLVMEGYTDVIMAHQTGFPNAVAVLGTALGASHVKLLRRYADRIILVLDGDEAGRRRTNQILELFVAEQVDLQVLTLPSGGDPCDFLLERGADAFQQLIDGAVDALEHKFNSAVAGMSAEGGAYEQNRALEEVLSTIAKAPRLQSGSTGAARLKEDLILHRMAHRFGASEASLRSRLTGLRRSARRRASSPARSPADAESPESTPRRVDPCQRELMELLLRQPRLLPDVRNSLTTDDFAPGPYRDLFERCCSLADGGQEPTFDALLMELEEPELKSLLVDLDERGRAKDVADVAGALRMTVATLRGRREEQERRRRQAVYRQGGLDEEGELRHLLQFINEKRSRQGISWPTEG